MKTRERRKAIANILSAEAGPITGAELSGEFGVSRQIIVRDINELKNMGFEIDSTHSGYLMRKSPLKERVFKLHHTTEQTEDELTLIVSLGGTIVDVYVWHKVYGKMAAPLNIYSALQVKQFIDGVRSGKSTELMNITGGYHYHTVRADSDEILNQIEQALSDRGYIAPGI